MQYSTLGRTGLRVSRAGFGGGGIGQVWGATTEADAIRSVHRALELGITFFDVAPSYGDGKAEEALGKALIRRTEDVVIATKVRLRADEMDDIAGAVRRSVEVSLNRLRRDSVDVLHVHNRFTEQRGEGRDSITGDDVMGPVLDAYKEMQREGKTRYIGLSAMDHHVPTMHRLINSGEWDTVLAYYNLLNTTAQEPKPTSADVFDNGQIIPLAKSKGMGVIGIRSHAAGALTPALDRPPAPGDALMEADLRKAAMLDFLLEGPIETLSQAAMVFSMMNRNIDSTVPGVKNEAEAEEIARCVDLPPISEAHMARLRELYERDFS